MDGVIYKLRSNPYFRSILWKQFTAKAQAAGYPPSAALNRLIRRYLERGFDDGQPETQTAADRHRQLATYDKLPLRRRVILRAPADGPCADEPLIYEVQGLPEDLAAEIVSHPSGVARLTAERRTWRVRIQPCRDGLGVKTDQYWLAGEYESSEEALVALEAALLRGELAAEPEWWHTDPTT